MPLPANLGDVIVGQWQVLSAPAIVIGTLDLDRNTYQFSLADNAQRFHNDSKFVAFMAQPIGVVAIRFAAGLDFDTAISEIPTPPMGNDYQRAYTVARIVFTSATSNTNMYRISLELDRQHAEMRPDFSATLCNHPYQLRRFF
jgi:hypothetical protein